MKKLMMAVAALFAVVSMATASTINWGTTAPALDNSGANLDGGTVYLVYLGSNGTLDASFDGTSWNLGDDQVVASTFILGSAQTTYSASWGYFSASTPVATGVGAVYAMIATDQGVEGTTLPSSGFYGVSGTYTQAKDGSTDDEDFTYTSSISVSTPVIPEPTTYALVGLAAAALALRKRFLKK